MTTTETGTPRVEACIEAVMDRFGLKSTAYFEEVHQHITPLARELERENADLRAALEAKTLVIEAAWPALLDVSITDVYGMPLADAIAQEHSSLLMQINTLQADYDKARAELAELRAALQAQQGDPSEPTSAWKVTHPSGETCHFGTAGGARAWGGEAATVEEIVFSRPALMVVGGEAQQGDMGNPISGDALDAARWRAFRDRDGFDDLEATDFLDQFCEDADAVIDAALAARGKG